jgi:hypothetical protein
MSYFTKFPIINGYDIQGQLFQMMDITRRTGFTSDVKNNESYYITHKIQDGESPIILADRLYDDSDLYWIIMLFNDIHDIQNDWPLDSVSLNRFIDRIYIDRNAIHHYEAISTNLVVDSDWPLYDRLPVTNYEYEDQINESKRIIKIPVPEAISQIVRDHNRLIQQ